MADQARLAIKVTHIVNRFQDCVDGILELTPTQVQAGKVLLDRTLPILQSADITAHSSPQIESEEALIAQLQALIAKYPQLISHLQSVQQGTPALPSPQEPVPQDVVVDGDVHTQQQHAITPIIPSATPK